ncbi:hypothetical protein BV20DRAFT_812701 [Pilatotrama ljubarskyi]|nr:hypothetical protein BV20DRAFT_812701 [Pilatotrama ljubarskyi]
MQSREPFADVRIVRRSCCAHTFHRLATVENFEQERPMMELASGYKIEVNARNHDRADTPTPLALSRRSFPSQIEEGPMRAGNGLDLSGRIRSHSPPVAADGPCQGGLGGNRVAGPRSLAPHAGAELCRRVLTGPVPSEARSGLGRVERCPFPVSPARELDGQSDRYVVFPYRIRARSVGRHPSSICQARQGRDGRALASVLSMLRSGRTSPSVGYARRRLWQTQYSISG